MSSLGIFAGKQFQRGESVPECSYHVCKVYTKRASPILRDGRIESFTNIRDQGLHFLAGPASLINAACCDCANVSLELDYVDEDQNTSICIRVIKQIEVEQELLASYGDDYRSDMFCCVCRCPLTRSGRIDARATTIPHVPVLHDMKSADFDPLCTGDYVAALHSEARMLESILSAIRPEK